MSCRASHTSGSVDERMPPLEDSISAHLQDLNLAGSRDRVVDDADHYEMDTVHDQLHNMIGNDRDEKRRIRLHEMLTESATMRKLILYLRPQKDGVDQPVKYYENAMNALSAITQKTYDAGYRKAAITLGVVEAGAELLVLEVRVWGAAASVEHEYLNGMGRNERRDVRKQIASVLTNLTFGSSLTKKCLADYNGFIPVVIEIIQNAPNLVPPFSNLLRNVSWPSCKGMHSLFTATPALARAAVEAHLRDDDKSVKSTLSALWNIVGSGEDECVRRVVEEEGCVEMLVGLLTADGHRTTVVEYSTGILKHAAAELVRDEKLRYCVDARARLISSLFPLLRSSSLTIVKNALSAVNEVAAKDPATVAGCMSSFGRDALERLQRSNDNDMRRPAKSILSHIGAGDGVSMMSRSAHVGNGRDMSSSHRSDRLLPRRSPFCSPALGGGGGGGAVPNGLPPSMLSSMESPSSSSHRASSLPRHFPPSHGGEGGGGMSTSGYGGTGQYMMGSPSPLYGNMDTIRAAAQQQQRRQQQQQPQPIPTNFPAPAPLGVPLNFATSFAPPPGSSQQQQQPQSGMATVSVAPPSFPSMSYAAPVGAFPAPAAFAPAPSSSQQLQQQQPVFRVPAPFGGTASNGQATLQFENGGERDESYGDDDDDDLSTQVTRAGSRLSMEELEDETHSQDVSGFHSTVETANNSARLSPVSYSDLPDSPTQCAAIRDQAIQLNLPSFHLPPMAAAAAGPFSAAAPSRGDGSTSSDGLSSSQTHSSHTTPNATSAEQTPTFATMNAQYRPNYDTPRADSHGFTAVAAAADSAPSTSAGFGSTADTKGGDDEDDDDYGVYGEDDLLDRSIEEALPRRVEEKRERMESFVLDASLPPYRSPSSRGSSRYSTSSTLKEEDILAAAIESAMPKVGSLSSPRGTLQQSKNGVARWSEEGRMTTEGQNKKRENEQKDKEEEESDESDSEYYGGAMSESIVGMMPRDVEEEVEAERIAIDCSSIKRKPRPPRSSQLPRHQSTLTTPTSGRLARQTTPTSGGAVSSAASNGRPSPRPSSIGRPRPLTSTPSHSRSAMNKFPPTPRVSAISLAGTPNGNSAHQRETTPPSVSTPPTTGSVPLQATPTSSSSSMSRLKRPTASAVVPPYNYQSPKSTPREDRKGSSPKEGKEVEEKKANGQILVTTV